MTLTRLLPAAATAALLAGCATVLPGDRTYSPVGQTLQVVAANGAGSRMTFLPGGAVRATFGQRSIDGRWEMGGDGLCFHWGSAPRECWPIQGPFVRGRTQVITSTRGNTVRVTRL